MNLFLNPLYESHSRHLVCLFGGLLCWLARHQTLAQLVNRSDTQRIFLLVVLYECGTRSISLSTF